MQSERLADFELLLEFRLLSLIVRPYSAFLGETAALLLPRISSGLPSKTAPGGHREYGFRVDNHLR